jgi:Protein of unknown function DUF262
MAPSQGDIMRAMPDVENDELFMGPEEPVEDEASLGDDQDVLPRYSVSSFGVDFDVAGLVRRIDEGDIEIPGFQRQYVWTPRQAARFVESFLMGLPVPGVFLWRDPQSEKLVVVDGQQRLRTLQYFYSGLLRGKEFVLPVRTSPYQLVHPDFQGKSYKTLDSEDRRRLNNSVLHATVVQQDDPSNDETSVYYLFERINTSGTPLQPQEIRFAIYQGTLSRLLQSLNEDAVWRNAYGPVSARRKDSELILRFLAMLSLSDSAPIDGSILGSEGVNYARPMKEFLNRFFVSHRQIEPSAATEMRNSFLGALGVVWQSAGKTAFRPSGAFNAAVFDSVMVGVARRLRVGPVSDNAGFETALQQLLSDPGYRDATSRATADVDTVAKRLRLATQAFADIP